MNSSEFCNCFCCNPFLHPDPSQSADYQKDKEPGYNQKSGYNRCYQYKEVDLDY